MKVLHGSKNLFDQFDARFIGTHDTLEGFGFYFTNSESVAKSYGENGYMYTVEFKGLKQLSDTELTVSKNELRTLLIQLDSETSYLSNWGEVEYDGLEKVLATAITGEMDGTENDVELVGSICNASGNIRRTLELVHTLWGHDSIVIPEAKWGSGQTIYVALVPDIISITSVEEV